MRSRRPPVQGLVENLAAYAQRDLVVPSVEEWETVEDANAAAIAWCEEVNAVVPSEIASIPAQRLVEEHALFKPLPSLRPPLRRGEKRKVDRLATVRSARPATRSPPGWSARPWRSPPSNSASPPSTMTNPSRSTRSSPPGSVDRRRPRRRSTPRTGPCGASPHSLGTGVPPTRRGRRGLPTRRRRSWHHQAVVGLADIIELSRAWGVDAVVAALERGLTFRWFTACDIRSILVAGAGVADVVDEGQPVELGLPDVAVRDLSAYALEEWS